MKNLVSIVMGLALTNTIVTLVTSSSASEESANGSKVVLPAYHALAQIHLQPILCALAVITAIVRFSHGNNRHLDLLYGRSSAYRTNAVTDGLGINFIVVMVQSVFFALMSFYVDGNRELLILFSALLLLDIFWLLANLTAADKEALGHQVKWAFNNVFFMVLIAILYAVDKTGWVVTAGAAAILLNTVIDFYISWEFYFPSLALGEE